MDAHSLVQQEAGKTELFKKIEEARKMVNASKDAVLHIILTSLPSSRVKVAETLAETLVGVPVLRLRKLATDDVQKCLADLDYFKDPLKLAQIPEIVEYIGGVPSLVFSRSTKALFSRPPGRLTGDALMDHIRRGEIKYSNGTTNMDPVGVKKMISDVLPDRWFDPSAVEATLEDTVHSFLLQCLVFLNESNISKCLLKSLISEKISKSMFPDIKKAEFTEDIAVSNLEDMGVLYRSGTEEVNVKAVYFKLPPAISVSQNTWKIPLPRSHFFN